MPSVGLDVGGGDLVDVAGTSRANCGEAWACRRRWCWRRSLEARQGELGIDPDREIGHLDQGIDDPAVLERVLERVTALGQGLGQEILQRPFADLAAELGTAEDVLEPLDVGAKLEHLLIGALEFADLAVELVEGLLVRLEVLGQGTLADLQGALEGLGGPVLGRFEGFKLLLEQPNPRPLPRDLPAGSEIRRDEPNQKRQHGQDQDDADGNEHLQHRQSFATEWVDYRNPSAPLPMLPIVGMAGQMHNGHDDDLIGLNPEQDPKREDLGQAAPHVEIHHGVKAWIDQNTVDRILDGREEPLAQICLLSLVVSGRLDHLGFGLGMKPHPHVVNLA